MPFTENCLVSDFEKLTGSFGPCFQPIIASAERFASCPRWGWEMDEYETGEENWI